MTTKLGHFICLSVHSHRSYVRSFSTQTMKMRIIFVSIDFSQELLRIIKKKFDFFKLI